MEIMLAFSLMILFTVSTFALSSSMHGLKIWSIHKLGELKERTHLADLMIANTFQDTIGYSSVQYGNDTQQVFVEPFVLNHSNYEKAWGRSSCNSHLSFDEDAIEYYPEVIDIGAGNASTDIEVRNGIVYLAADSTSASAKDFIIIDTRDPSHAHMLSSLNTGPGLSALEVAGPYVFAAQASSVNQLQIIDIQERSAPSLISQIKLPLPTPTTTAPFATSIFYSQGFIYLGTSKWSGPEFAIIDVSNVQNPLVVGTYETGTLISDIYVRDNRAYLASADEKQMRALDVSDKSQPVLAGSFSPSGWQTQEGKTIDHFEGQLGLGRTVGGFNVQVNHEAFVLDNDMNYVSKDIPGGVYGILMRPPYIFLATHSPGRELQVWTFGFDRLIYETPLGISPEKMSCDGSTLYFATGNSKGISLLKLYE